jgi:hypothetical protein
MPEPEFRKVFVLYVNIEILCDDEEFVYDKERLLPILFTRQLKKQLLTYNFQQMKYKGIVGAWKTEVNTPAVKLLSIVTDTKENTSDWSHVLPKHEITEKERATAQMIAASSNVLSLKALVDLKEWKNVHGKDSTYTLNRDIVWAKAEYARAGFKFQK